MQIEKDHISDETVLIVKCPVCHRVEYCALNHKHICGYCGWEYRVE